MSVLVSYSSSEDSEEETALKSKNQAEVKQCTTSGISEMPLPVPDDIRGLFSERNDAGRMKDDPKQHAGRVRSFPHQEGNWATAVFAKYETDEHFFRMQQELFKCLRPLEFHPMDDYHISISRTVTIRHHWIQDISDSLAKQFAGIEGCCCEIDGVDVLTNDEKTRSFLTLSVSSADDLLQNYVAEVDLCFEEYKLQKYYQPPVFHVSIGWCLGDVTTSVLEATRQKLKVVMETALQENTEMKYFYVDQLHMKTGNKSFVFQLDT